MFYRELSAKGRLAGQWLYLQYYGAADLRSGGLLSSEHFLKGSLDSSETRVDFLRGGFVSSEANVDFRKGGFDSSAMVDLRRGCLDSSEGGVDFRRRGCWLVLVGFPSRGSEPHRGLFAGSSPTRSCNDNLRFRKARSLLSDGPASPNSSGSSSSSSIACKTKLF